MSVSNVSGIMNNYYGYIASGKQINSAADDAAGLAIAEQLKSTGNSLAVGSDNAAAGQDLLRTAEGGLSSIMDNLQRMRELSVQAGNTAIYGPSELNAIQAEIDQLKQSIQDTANNTQFNTMDLLNGDKSEWNITTNHDGSGHVVNTPDATLEMLGIEDYDVSSGNFDIGVLDDAIEKVSGYMADIGASSNALQYQINYNDYAVENLLASRSRIEDLDIPKAVSELEKERVINEYQLFFMKKKMEEENQVTRLLAF